MPTERKESERRLFSLWQIWTLFCLCWETENWLQLRQLCLRKRWKVRETREKRKVSQFFHRLSTASINTFVSDLVTTYFAPLLNFVASATAASAAGKPVDKEEAVRKVKTKRNGSSHFHLISFDFRERLLRVFTKLGSPTFNTVAQRFCRVVFRTFLSRERSQER